MGNIKRSTLSQKKSIVPKNGTLDVREILETMYDLFRDYPLTELNYETPFQCLIAVMMSAQTTDIQVNKVTDTLFQTVKDPQDILNMGEEALGEAIRTVGLWTSKKKNIYRTAELLIEKSKESTSITLGKEGDQDNVKEVQKGKKDGVSSNQPAHEVGSELYFYDAQQVFQECGYRLPDTIDEMTELPGVGIKTAKVVLYVLYRQLRVAVDTHVHRVMNRLGVVSTKTPDQSSKALEVIIPDDYKAIAHHSIIYFGRYLCKAKKPECHRCPLWESCRWEGKLPRTN